MTLLTVHQLAQFVGVSDRTIEKWWSEGKLPQPYMRSWDHSSKLWTPAQAREILQIRKTAADRKAQRRIRRT